MTRLSICICICMGCVCMGCICAGLLTMAPGPAIAAVSQRVESTSEPAPAVVLLHGLGRSAGSMEKMAEALSEAGFRARNIDYPATEKPVADLAQYVDERMGDLVGEKRPPLHFVTHSLGGIVVRYLLKGRDVPNLGRVVMLAPPNQGSEVAEHLRSWDLYRWINGPAGQQLGTGPDSLPRRLGQVDFPLGVIAGNDPLFTDWAFSAWLPEPHDGKVSVASTKVAGMKDFLVVPHGHTFIMSEPDVIRQTIHFLKYGCFEQGQNPFLN